MFENILGQDAAKRLAGDIAAGLLAPSMLFSGPVSSGKGSAALELARSLSCAGNASWNCSCSSCVRHRSLVHPDLLLLGPRRFAAEIAASRAGFLRDPENPAALALFVRSVRKLLGRFSPVLVEDEPRMGKFNGIILALEEDLEELEQGRASGENVSKPGRAEKISSALETNALKLEEGIGETIPIARIRRAAYWSHLAASGKIKFLLIENADRMQEGARNSLLKILEEPPEHVFIVLTTASSGAILPTIRSRLRPYHFVQRGREAEAEVIRRIFRDADASFPSVAAYLDSFLPVSDEKLKGLAAFFIASVAKGAALILRKRGIPLPEELVQMGTYTAPIAGGTPREGTPREGRGTAEILSTLLEGTGNFEGRGFPRFLASVLDLVSASLSPCRVKDPRWIVYNEIWRKGAGKAAEAAAVNQVPALALERLIQEVRDAMVDAAAAWTGFAAAGQVEQV
jgi:DNA polymerase-3 subunit gamma/tau